MLREYGQVRELLEKSERILIVSHRKPDADTLGCALALKFWLARSIGKEITLACVDKPSPVFSFLPGVNEFVSEFDLKNFDLVVIVDAGASYMTDFHLKYDNFFTSGLPIVNIDHHASNDKFGTVNVVDSAAASATVILYRMFRHWEVQIDEIMATLLLAGIYNDTGGFMHSNTDGEVYEIAADLMEKGAQVAPISKSMFRNKSVSALKLWGKVLEKVCITSDNVVVSVVKDDDYDVSGADPEQLSGIIDYLTMVPNTKFAVLINEDRRGRVKGSFRTQKNDVDLSKIAATFGGGGHAKASGFMLPGKLKEETRYSIVLEDMSKKSLEF